MVNHNGHITEAELISINNRGFTYGDAVFETIKVVKGRINFWEDHYFRLMASMRILRMEIPMSFTLEFLKDEILRAIEANNLIDQPVRVKVYVNRKTGGRYTPEDYDVDYIISVEPLEAGFYEKHTAPYVVDLYKDYYVAPGLLSGLKTNNRAINVVGSVYAKENGLDNCLLLNTNKEVIEALNANIFLVKEDKIKTPAVSSGCIKGIIRKQLIDIIGQMPELTLEETPISPFELQKADELFLTNTIIGIQPITRYRKKSYTTETSDNLLSKLNLKARS